MRGHNLRNIALPIDDILNLILDNEEAAEYIRSRGDKKLKLKIAQVRHKRATMTMETKRKFLTELNFEKVSEECWRMKRKGK